uniref:Uncharacterized protein n=1 Tax=Anguilla anguilla TaxID=7936 RepID=A0A0E9QV32_ANGAN
MWYTCTRSMPSANTWGALASGDKLITHLNLNIIKATSSESVH